MLWILAVVLCIVLKMNLCQNAWNEGNLVSYFKLLSNIAAFFRGSVHAFISRETVKTNKTKEKENDL